MPWDLMMTLMTSSFRTLEESGELKTEVGVLIQKKTKHTQLDECGKRRFHVILDLTLFPLGMMTFLLPLYLGKTFNETSGWFTKFFGE